MNNSKKIKTISTSRVTAQAEDIILRETSKTRLIFRPLLLNNQNNQEACVKGEFIYQRQENGSWNDFKDENLRANKLKSGEGISISLKSEDVLKLLGEFQNLSKIYKEHGIKYSDNEYVLVDKNIEKALHTILSNDKEEILKALESLDGSEASTLIQNINETNLDKLLQFWDGNYEKEKNNEPFWQDLFEKNAWVLSQIIGSPHVYLKGQRYFGGKRIDGKGGVEGDFLFQNKLTKSIAIIEIKKPSSKIIGGIYRGKESDSNNRIYNIYPELTGAVNQLQNQRNQFHENRKNNEDWDKNSHNSKAILICGDMSLLDENKKKSFELYRNSLGSIEIITYDELRERLELLKECYKQ